MGEVGGGQRSREISCASVRFSYCERFNPLNKISYANFLISFRCAGEKLSLITFYSMRLNTRRYHPRRRGEEDGKEKRENENILNIKI